MSDGLATAMAVPTLMFGINGIASILANGFRSGKNYVMKNKEKILYYKISFDPKENPRCKRAIIQKIRDLNLHIKDNNLIISDGLGDNINYNVKNKTYHIMDKNIGKILITISDDEFIIKSYRMAIYSKKNKKVFSKNNLLEFKKYVEDLYKEYNAPSKITLFFTSDGNKWLKPILRLPRNFKKLFKTKEMKSALKNINKFMKKKKIYSRRGHAFRKGFLFYGETGTGKSTMPEIISKKYNMPIYLLTLNSKKMTDSDLINLLCSIPPNSIIVIDEIDKQLEALKNNKKAFVTIAGLLTALDGPQRLSDSTLIILTANKLDFLSDENKIALFRKGRIDKIFNFKNKVQKIKQKKNKSKVSN